MPTNGLASFPGHSHVFNVTHACVTLKTWACMCNIENVGVAWERGYKLSPQACEYYYKGHDPHEVSVVSRILSLSLY